MSRRAIDFKNLSKEDKEQLRQLLQDQKKALEAALHTTNKEIADLRRSKTAKKAKKTKKAKKAKT
jgi:hypothetical protein